MRTVYDISRTLSSELAVWPGDQPYEHDWTNEIAKGSLANVGRIRLSLHAGTHADAPYHYESDGPTIDDLPLSVFAGEALVVDAGDVDVIDRPAIASFDGRLPERILIKTRHSLVPDETWVEDFPIVDPSLADFLGEQGVRLLGVDSPSVDPFNTSDMAAHHALARNDVIILENLQLALVPPGMYLLVAAPLKLRGMDGSPVRALLIKEE